MSFGIFRRKVKFSDVEKCIVRIGYISKDNAIYFFDANGKRKSFGIVYYENIDKICHELSKHVINIEVFNELEYEPEDNNLSDDAKKIIEKSLLKPTRPVFFFLAILFLVVAGALGYYCYSEWDSFYTLSDRIFFHYISPFVTIVIVLLAILLLTGSIFGKLFKKKK